ncbi:UDP-3-O-acyl-N-acetylglucosamine deacetylase [Microvirga sp. 17 mud 1-3]|uniref:UDP-3-O-acyl-N-acetylglucosamine deacetylase n=1 Tax=Microvirga sp. 17 mud 1-3 TaxID=2082949 RepID=UPI000D6D9F54|nr:UDP-3-O-acyl-N-acetylglucosamine deacetylase [Microvirga sp. 17 mud 1-3]AWM89026.1 UDP-3-O-[3-hydroxymyristoyl] N-acetylglucosamine deacetylase [Microvirga sp. 17 mud 1-3]
MKQSQQTTLRAAVALTGAGVHSGDEVKIVLHPAEVNHGIAFLRTGLPGGHERLIDARHLAVTATELCTVIGDRDSGAVATIEHLMAALTGLGIDNVLVEIDGPEVPILDGSSAPFIDAIDQVGLVAQTAARRYLKVLKPVRVTQGKAFAELLPNERAFRLDVEIDFPTPVIGRQRKSVDLSPSVFRKDISRARTFGFMRDVEKLWSAGFALGASLENTVAIGDDGIMNPEGLRYADEFVRHKILDAVGDLSLAGFPLLGTYRSYCGGHRLNFSVLEALFESRSNYAVVDSGARRETGYAELGSGIAVPAYAPDVH